jgi:hydrogenase maturation protease
MLLVIGYGNELRRDDGIGPRVARAVAEWGLLDVSTHAVHQLTPELADDIARAKEVVFVDATAEDGTGNMFVQPVQAALSGSLEYHVSNPPALLALVEALFGRRPVAWLLTVPAYDLGFGDELTPEAQEEMGRTLNYLRGWIIQHTASA